MQTLMAENIGSSPSLCHLFSVYTVGNCATALILFPQLFTYTGQRLPSVKYIFINSSLKGKKEGREQRREENINSKASNSAEIVKEDQKLLGNSISVLIISVSLSCLAHSRCLKVITDCRGFSGGPPKDKSISKSLGTLNMTIFGQRVFADISRAS